MEFRLRNIPDELYIELKVIAARERKPVNKKIIELIREEVSKKKDRRG